MAKFKKLEELQLYSVQYGSELYEEVLKYWNEPSFKFSKSSELGKLQKYITCYHRHDASTKLLIESKHDLSSVHELYKLDKFPALFSDSFDEEDEMEMANMIYSVEDFIEWKAGQAEYLYDLVVSGELDRNLQQLFEYELDGILELLENEMFGPEITFDQYELVMEILHMTVQLMVAADGSW
jgi:hypothetical protein